jgi:hypothetical protein
LNHSGIIIGHPEVVKHDNLKGTIRFTRSFLSLTLLLNLLYLSLKLYFKFHLKFYS